jgi:UDP-N-acetyl-D-mannosaminuronate dehydrogenase
LEKSEERYINVLKQSNTFQLYGIDLDAAKLQEHQAKEPPKQPKTAIDVLQICIPVPNKNKFINIAKSYIQEYQPTLTIINSTVPIGTTAELHKQVGGLIAHSPCRGVHKKQRVYD